MGRLFKLGTGQTGVGRKRSPRRDWHSKIRMGPYQFKRARLCTDAGASETWAALLQAAVDRKAAGEPPDPDAMKKLPGRLLESFGLVSGLSTKRRGTYAESVTDYVRELETAGRDRKYIRNVENGLTALGEACDWKRLADVNRDALADYLTRRKAGGSAPRTLNNAIATVGAFGAWCAERKRLDTNPFDRTKRVDATADRRRRRRALMPVECSRLLAVAGIRKLVYRTALGTGLRLRELKLLQWRDVDLADPMRPCLRLRADATKSKRADVLPLAPALATRLRAFRPTDAPATDPVFRNGSTRTLVPRFETWLDDLERAGITYKGDDGTILGFHSLRVTYVTELQRAGLPPRTVMQLARHTDYRLTAETYTDMRLIDTFGAVQSLPDYAPEPIRQVASRTGTDDLPVGVGTQDQIQDQKTRPSEQLGASACSDAENREHPWRREGTDRKPTVRRKTRHFPYVHAGDVTDPDFRGELAGVGFEPTTSGL